MGLLLYVVYLRHRAETAEGITETESVYNPKTPGPPTWGLSKPTSADGVFRKIAHRLSKTSIIIVYRLALIEFSPFQTDTALFNYQKEII